jgi:hypothetical protein
MKFLNIHKLDVKVGDYLRLDSLDYPKEMVTYVDEHFIRTQLNSIYDYSPTGGYVYGSLGSKGTIEDMHAIICNMFGRMIKV